jgi:hypothetical protein
MHTYIHTYVHLQEEEAAQESERLNRLEDAVYSASRIADILEYDDFDVRIVRYIMRYTCMSLHYMYVWCVCVYACVLGHLSGDDDVRTMLHMYMTVCVCLYV